MTVLPGVTAFLVILKLCCCREKWPGIFFTLPPPPQKKPTVLFCMKCTSHFSYTLPAKSNKYYLQDWKLFKYGGPVLSNRLLELINKCWKGSSIPEEWGQARVKSLFKKGKRDDCSDYRGISLVNSGYKIYAKIITQRSKLYQKRYYLKNKTDSE